MKRALYCDDHAVMIAPGKPYRPANGTEGMMFEEMWCNECERDRRFRQSKGQTGGCSILARALAFDAGDPDYPKEWMHGLGGQPMCTAFRPEGTRARPPRRRPAPLFDNEEESKP